jgi:hypothetical protein
LCLNSHKSTPQVETSVGRISSFCDIRQIRISGQNYLSKPDIRKIIKKPEVVEKNLRNNIEKKKNTRNFKFKKKNINY